VRIVSNTKQIAPFIRGLRCMLLRSILQYTIAAKPAYNSAIVSETMTPRLLLILAVRKQSVRESTRLTTRLNDKGEIV
jgi:hypothetical protein